jgi:hypothetical protein
MEYSGIERREGRCAEDIRSFDSTKKGDRAGGRILLLKVKSNREIVLQVLRHFWIKQNLLINLLTCYLRITTVEEFVVK